MHFYCGPYVRDHWNKPYNRNSLFETTVSNINDVFIASNRSICVEPAGTGFIFWVGRFSASIKSKKKYTVRPYTYTDLVFDQFITRRLR